ncbi:MAG: lyase family protein, partial [Paracoccaceae bacterium]
LFTDSAEIRAMLLVEGALARAQGALGMIPPDSAAVLSRAMMEIQIDPAALSAATSGNGVSVPGLVQAARDELQAPEHAQYLHWGATSQDIIDTALMLRLKRVLDACDATLDRVLSTLARLAVDHADLPMAARTYGQDATPTSFGAQCAGWGWPLLAVRADLAELRATGLWVSLSGAAGTASQLGPDPMALRADLAQALGLHDPGRSWHTDRTPVLRLADAMGRALAALGKLGEDLTLAVQSGIAEVALGQGGASSTMPQKQNPVGPSVLVALAAQGAGQVGTLHAAGLHRQARDGAAWFTEWLVLPQLCLGLAAALHRAETLTQSLAPQPAAMAAHLDAARGLTQAEALTFVLCQQMPRPEAHARVKALCAEVIAGGGTLAQVAQTQCPDLPEALLHDACAPQKTLGTAPQEAHAFAAAVQTTRAVG